MVGILMGNKNVPDGLRFDAQPAHFFFQAVIVIAGINHDGGIALAVEKDIGHPLPHTGHVFIDPTGIQRLKDLLPAVHFAHFFLLELGCLFRHTLTSFRKYRWGKRSRTVREKRWCFYLLVSFG